MAKLIKLTEQDLHNIIREAVSEITLSEDWRKAYDDWADNLHLDSQDEGERKNKEWTRQLKQEFPDPKKREAETKKHMKQRDLDKGKIEGGKYKKEYRDDDDE